MLDFESEFANCRFKWGVSDCCLSVSNVLALRGVDPMLPWRGKYDTRRGALKFIKSFGSLEFAANSLFTSLCWQNIQLPKKYDVGLIDGDWGVSMGLFDGSCWWVKSENGAVLMTKFKRAWRCKWLLQ